MRQAALRHVMSSYQVVIDLLRTEILGQLILVARYNTSKNRHIDSIECSKWLRYISATNALPHNISEPL
jgi:hypothetical protein